MRFIDKTDAPDFFVSDTQGLTRWVDYDASNKRKLKKHILDKEQYNLCCYCESKVNEDLSNTHLEHIFPKSVAKYVFKTFDYNNLLVSCDGTHFNEIVNGDAEHCGHKKNNLFNEDLFLNPTVVTDLHLYFKFNKDTGIISQTKQGGNKAAYTILLLNLNGSKNRIAQARIIAKNTVVKLLQNKTPEETKQTMNKILDNKSVQFHSFLKHCFIK